MPNRINVMKYLAQKCYNKNKESSLKHYGVLGMHCGIRRYQDYGEGGYTPKSKLKMDLQRFSYDPTKEPTYHLPKDEWAHVMSEFETNRSEEEKRNREVIIHTVDNYDYTFAKNVPGSDDFNIVDKNLSSNSILDLYEEAIKDDN